MNRNEARHERRFFEMAVYPFCIFGTEPHTFTQRSRKVTSDATTKMISGLEKLFFSQVLSYNARTIVATFRVQGALLLQLKFI